MEFSFHSKLKKYFLWFIAQNFCIASLRVTSCSVVPFSGTTTVTSKVPISAIYFSH